jgi:hypothetical protein
MLWLRRLVTGSQVRGPGSNTGQSMCNLWWQSGNGTGFFLSTSIFPSVLFHQYSILMHSSITDTIQSQNLTASLNTLRGVSVRYNNTDNMIICQLFMDPLLTYSDFHPFSATSCHGCRGDTHAKYLSLDAN